MKNCSIDAQTLQRSLNEEIISFKMNSMIKYDDNYD